MGSDDKSGKAINSAVLMWEAVKIIGQVLKEVVAELADFGRPPSDGPGDFVNRLWKALLRDLEKEDGSYKR